MSESHHGMNLAVSGGDRRMFGVLQCFHNLRHSSGEILVTE